MKKEKGGGKLGLTAKEQGEGRWKITERVRKFFSKLT